MNLKRKLLSITLTLAMILSMVPTFALATDPSSWQDTGVPDTSWMIDGKGSSSDPYLISTAAELAGLALLVNGGNAFVGKYIKLSQDIDLAGKNWVPIGATERFSGNFDGAGHVITNMTIGATSNFSAALFGTIYSQSEPCSITNLGVSAVKIEGYTGYAGTLAAYVVVQTTDITVSNCFTSGDLQASYFCGGLFGYMIFANGAGHLNMSNCYTNCNITMSKDCNSINYCAGGLIGQFEGFQKAKSSISNCYSTTAISAPSATKVGGLIGNVNNHTDAPTADILDITDCLFDRQVAGIGYGFDPTSGSIDGVQAMNTSAMAGTSVLPSTWDKSIWKKNDNLYPQLSTFCSENNSAANLSSLLSAIPINLKENTTSPSLSDTVTCIRNSFTLPSINGVRWSVLPGTNLALSSADGGNVSFTSPTSNDTKECLTATIGTLSKSFMLTCKAGVNPSDITPPTLSSVNVSPSDFSARIEITSDEAAKLYVLAKATSASVPTANEILSDSNTVQCTATSSVLTATANINSLSCMTDYTAFVVGVDASGNASDVVSQNFKTIQDQTPPTRGSFTNAHFSRPNQLDFSADFNENGTLNYIIVPASNSTPPSNDQVFSGLDANGSPAYFSGTCSILTKISGYYNYAQTLDTTNFAPGCYNIYYACVDAIGNKSNVYMPLADASKPSFELKEDLTITVTDGANPLDGALVTIGNIQKTTGADGIAQFTLPAGSYNYLIQKTGYKGITAGFSADKLCDSKTITMTAGGGGIQAVTFALTDGNGPINKANITIGSDTKTTDTNGNAVFYLETNAAPYNYSINSAGRLPDSGTLAVGNDNLTKSIALTTDPNGVSVVLDGHVEGSLSLELSKFKSDNGLSDSKNLISLKVNGGSLNQADMQALSPSYTFKTVDFSATSFQNKTLPAGSFYSNSSISKVILPADTTTIGTSAFEGCSKLTNIILPESLTAISNNAFCNCSGLTGINLPQNLTSISNNAFEGCTALKDISANAILTASSVLPTVGSNAFPSSATLRVPKGNGQYYRAANDGNPLDRKWFNLFIEDADMSNPYLQPLAVQRISKTEARVSFQSDEAGKYYFAVVGDNATAPVIDTSGPGVACTTDPTSIKLAVTESAQDVYVVVKDADGNVSNPLKFDLIKYTAPVALVIDIHQAGKLEDEISAKLDSVGIPGKFNSIISLKVNGGILNKSDQDYFYDDIYEWNIKTLDLSATTFQNDQIRSGLFSESNSYVSVLLPNVPTIPDDAFEECHNLASMTLPAGVTKIGESAFSGCSSLKEITLLSAKPPSVGKDAFKSVAANAQAKVPYASKASYISDADGNTSDNLWHGLVITTFGDGETTPSTPNTGSKGGGSQISSAPETSLSSGKVTTTAKLAATADSAGNATANFLEGTANDAINKALSEAKKTGPRSSTNVTFVASSSNAASTTITVPAKSIKLAANEKINEMTFSSPVASITFDEATMANIAAQIEAPLTIQSKRIPASSLSAEAQQLVGSRPVFSFSVSSGDKKISQFSGNVTVTIPYTLQKGENPDAIVIYYIDDSGKATVVSNCVYDAKTGAISFSTKHFSTYAVGYHVVTFADVPQSAWYSEAVSFLAARSVATGTGNNLFCPDAKVTRAEFLVMVMRAFGIEPTKNAANNFSDAGNTYYTLYLAAAKEKGISSGIGNNQFAPDNKITRQEMSVLLYSTLKAFGKLPSGTSGSKLSTFQDYGQIAPWATEAMTLLVETGTVNGDKGMLSPTAELTRAELAQMIYNVFKQ